MAPGNQDFSTLEAVDPSYEPFQKQKALPTVDFGKQVVPEEEKYAIAYNDGPEVAPNQHLPSAQQFPLEPSLYEKQLQRYRNRRRLNWILIGVVILLVVILAAVVGGVLGSKKAATTSTPSSNDAVAQHQRAVAAVSFASNGINNTRVYYQDDAGGILEAAKSASSTTWRTSPLGYTGTNKTSLAAAVSRPGFPLEISIFYTDEHYLVHDLIYDSTTGEWNPGTISGMHYITHPSSTLSAMYNQCRLCANTTIMAYQDINGFIQVANQTSLGWTLTQLNLDPFTGTGLALHPFFRQGYEDQINLFYQQSTLNTSLASWIPGGLNNGIYAWSPVQQLYNIAVPATPLAAASSYTNVPTGFDTWIQVLQLSDQGIEVSTWSGAINDWLEYYYHPSPMANSTANVKTYGNFAVTAIGSAFAVVKDTGVDTIQSWQVNDNMLDWTATGTVDTGNSWS